LLKKGLQARHRIEKSCDKSKIKRCFRQYPKQLTFKEVSKIEEIVNNMKNFGKTKTSPNIKIKKS